MLPTEIWDMILSDLPSITLFNVSRVCRLWKNIINNNINWERRFVLDCLYEPSKYLQYFEYCNGEDFVNFLRVGDMYGDAYLNIDLLGDGTLYIRDNEENQHHDSEIVDGVVFSDHEDLSHSTSTYGYHMSVNEDYKRYVWMCEFFNTSLRNMPKDISTYFLSHSENTILPFIGNTLSIITDRLEAFGEYTTSDGDIHTWEDLFYNGIEWFQCEWKYCRTCIKGRQHCGNTSIFDFREGIREFKNIVDSIFDTEKIAVQHVHNCCSEYVGFLKITLPILISGRECGFFLFLEKDG